VLDPRALFEALRASGVREFSGVPCSILDPIVTAAEQDTSVAYVPASVEGEAVAIAAGAWLGGSLGAVFLQNSGLGNTINPLASLAIPYGIPLVMIVSWRGEPGREDALHHYPMGAATPGLFDLFGIPFETLIGSSDLSAVAARACERAVTGRKPAAIVVPRGVFPKSPSPKAKDPGPRVGTSSALVFQGSTLPSRADVMPRLVGRAADAPIVSTTGYTSRDLGSWDQARHFPMQGSMGFALALGLGLTRAVPNRRVVVIDGDGALIMRLGSLATAGHLKSAGLTHVVLDNGTYASTGGQASVSSNVDFATIALACGYARAATCLGREGLDDALAFAFGSNLEGPVLLRIFTSAEEPQPKERPETAPPVIASRFRGSLASEGAPRPSANRVIPAGRS
jgi:phosphonopyruvate decarboxylase